MEPEGYKANKYYRLYGLKLMREAKEKFGGEYGGQNQTNG